MAGAIGWKGFGLIGSTSQVLPFTRFDLDERTSIYPSEGIHGGGVSTTDGRYYSQINFSIGQIIYQGNLEGEAWGKTSTQFGAAFKALLQNAFTSPNRDTGFTSSNALILAPTGEIEYAWQYPNTTDPNSRAVISSFTLNSRVGSNVTFSCEVISAGRTAYAGAQPSPSDFSYEPAPQSPPFTSATIDTNPIPYWATDFNLTGTGETDINSRITEWSININNNSVPIFVHNGNPFAIDVLQGIMEITGSFKYYSPDGTFVTNLTHGATLSVNMGDYLIKSDFVAFNSAPVPNPGVNAPVTREVSFRCFASSSNASLYIA